MSATRFRHFCCLKQTADCLQYLFGNARRGNLYPSEMQLVPGSKFLPKNPVCPAHHSLGPLPVSLPKKPLLVDSLGPLVDGLGP